MLSAVSETGQTDLESTSQEADFSLLENRPIRLACNVFPPQKVALPSETDFPGYDIELIREAFISQGLTTEFGFFPWKRAYIMVQSGQYDALCSCSWLPEREGDFRYSHEMGRVSKGVFTLNAGNINDLRDFRGKSVGVVSGYNLEDELKAAGVFTPHTVVTDDLLLNLLTYRRVEAIYSYQNTIRSLMKTRQTLPQLHYHELDNSPYYLCVTRQSEYSAKIVEQFNEGIARLKASQRYRKILERYLPAEDPQLPTFKANDF